MIETYTRLFAIILPITSILLIPQIQGTTPGLLMALLSPLIVLISNDGRHRKYWQGIIFFFYVFLFFLFASQLSLIFGDYGSRANLILIRSGPLEPIRLTIFTQGLYLISGYLTFILFAIYYTEKWDKFIIAGGVILATIGLAEWLYFLASGADFSFISNRTFGEGLEGSGSLVQTISIMGHSLLRLKSFTGEPSMYALTVFPYMVFCIARRRFVLAAYLGITLLLSTSTTALLGFVVFGLLMVIFYSNGIGSKILNLLILISLFGIFAVVFQDLIVHMVVEKLMLENVSGFDRFFNIRTNLEFWLNSGYLIKIFGIGWGTIRSTDMLTTLLVNTGISGVFVWLFFFLKPTIRVQKKESVTFVLNLGIITVLFLLLIAVSEYSYLPTWMFLGILYNLIDINSKATKQYKMEAFHVEQDLVNDVSIRVDCPNIHYDVARKC